MIQVVFTKSNNRFTALKVSGHAYSDEPGKDLVCAAVSTLAQTTVNAVEALGEIPEERIFVNIKNGYLELIIKELDATDVTDVVFKTMIIGLIGIEETYPQYVKHRIKEVHGNVENI